MYTNFYLRHQNLKYPHFLPGFLFFLEEKKSAILSHLKNVNEVKHYHNISYLVQKVTQKSQIFFHHSLTVTKAWQLLYGEHFFN